MNHQPSPHEILRNIVQSANMSARPEFYSGREAMTCDLNSKQLSIIHDGVKKSFGNDSAKSFVQMVNDIEVMSATNFLVTLYRLQGNNWEWYDSLEENSGVAIDGFGSAFATVAETLSKQGRTFKRDETQEIKSPFLRSKGVQPKFDLDKKRGWMYYTEYYGKEVR